MGDFLPKERILQWKILHCGRLGWGLKIFGPKYQKAHRYAKTGRINRLASSCILTLYGAEKKACENGH